MSFRRPTFKMYLLSFGSAQKLASDPAYNLAAQLLATEPNFQAGAGSYTSGGNEFSKADATLANSLATTLDRYNNNLLC